MSEESPRAWVGDRVYDPHADREGIITDVKGGVYILRPPSTWAGTWTAHDPAQLKVTLSREERLKQRRDQP